MREFRIGTICTQLRGKESAPNRVPDGLINMVNETSSNNGITKKACSDFVFGAPAVTVSVNYAETVFLQDEPFCASVNILILRNQIITECKEVGLYIAAVLRKNNKQYDYTHKISKDKLNETNIQLPIQTDKVGVPVIDDSHKYHPEGYVPDWDYMAAYIRAMEKLVIRDVVDFKDAFIRNAKLVAARKDAV